MVNIRPSGLAREHGLSAQTVRNYERDGFIPAASRSPSGYRLYTPLHAVALRAHLALVRAYGYSVGGDISRSLNARDLDAALTAIDRGHAQLLRDRGTLDAVEQAVIDLTIGAASAETGQVTSQSQDSLSIGELARRLGVTAATLRNWEAASILAPARTPGAGHRTYRVSDVRDAELTHLLRRGGHSLEQIRTVVDQVHTAGGADALAAALGDWRLRLTARAVAMLDAATSVSGYVELMGIRPGRV